MIQRELHIYCDKCGAEGPHVVGEKRPVLLQSVRKLGWKLRDDNTHVCMECAVPKVVPEVQPDRSVHWTEARKKHESH